MYDMGMDENPYQSPKSRHPIAKKELLPLWRVAITVILIAFGLLYCLSEMSTMVAFADRERVPGESVLSAILVLSITVGILWSASWLLRRRE
jgi:uncharacterized BrkB/YihY/UPF0761 family membrane protein